MTKAVEELVRQQSARFQEALLRRDFAAMAPLLTPEAVWEVAPPFAQQHCGAANIISGVRRDLEQLEVVSHQQSAPIVAVRGANFATVERSTEDQLRFHDGRELRVSGTWVDLMLTYRGTWRVAHRVFRAKHIDQVR